MKRAISGNGSDGTQQKFPRPATDLSRVVIRFLFPARAAGVIIGKGGENIKKWRMQYNIQLNIPENRGPERVMTIEGDLQAICDALKEVSPKLKEILNAKFTDPKMIMGTYVPRRRRPQADGDAPGNEEEEENLLDYRILVHQSQAGSVIGRNGDRIKELRDKYKMRVIKVYSMYPPASTDRVVQMVAEPENAINCLKSVIEAVESAPPRGPRDDYDAMNFCEAKALEYGGWLSKEAAYALSQHMPIGRPGGMPPAGYMGNPYMMGNEMGPMPPSGMWPMSGGMGMPGAPPMAPGPRGPVGGGGGRGAPFGGRGRGHMMVPGGPPVGGQRSVGGPAPVPPPNAPRGGGPPVAPAAGGYGATAAGPAYGNQGYDANDGYGSMYDSMNPWQMGYGGAVNPGMPATYGATGYGAGASRGAGDMPSTNVPRGGTYNAYDTAGQGAQDDAKANAWYDWS